VLPALSVLRLVLSHVLMRKKLTEHERRKSHADLPDDIVDIVDDIDGG
jgi:hypothetical protein